MPPKGEYWKYFEKNDNTYAKCRLCSKKVKTSGNTSNLKSHMRMRHSQIIQRGCQPTAEEATNTTISNTAVPSSDTSVILRSAGTESEKEGTTVQKMSGFTQPTVASCFKDITSYAETGPKGMKLTQAILYMICKDSQPFTIVENEGFLHLMKTACPNFKVPSRFTLKRLLETKYDVIKQHIKEVIKNLASVTLTTDVWTDTMAARSFLGLNLLFYNNGTLQTCSLGLYDLTQPKTADYLADVLKSAMEEWGIENSKVTAIVTDGAPNIVRAAEDVYGKKFHIHCFAHVINLVAQKALESLAGVQNLLMLVKKIVTWFRQCVTASDELRKESDLKLIQEVQTRWNSTYYMVERFLKLRPYVNHILNNHTSAPPMLNAKQIIELSEVCSVLKPLECVTKELCGSGYVTSSKSIPLTKLLTCKIQSIKVKETVAESLRGSILNEIEKRLTPVENVTVFAIATLLDPRFKNIHFQSRIACSRAIEKLKQLLITQQLTEEPLQDEMQNNEVDMEDIWSEHKLLLNEKRKAASNDMPTELSLYLRAPLADLKEDPLTLWDGILGSTYPCLKDIAIKYLSCTATSVLSERFFSKAGQTLCQQRNRLKGKLLSKILFLQSVDKKLWDI